VYKLYIRALVLGRRIGKAIIVLEANKFQGKPAGAQVRKMEMDFREAKILA
jgi:hypothetical protein